MQLHGISIHFIADSFPFCQVNPGQFSFKCVQSIVGISSIYELASAKSPGSDKFLSRAVIAYYFLNIRPAGLPLRCCILRRLKFYFQGPWPRP
jgi:hypothetical protein